MNHKKYIIGALIIVTVLLLFFFAKPYKTEAPSRAVTETFRPEVTEIASFLYQKSTEYQAQEKRQQEIEAELTAIEASLVNLRESAAAYDTILCRDYQVRYVRPSPAAAFGALRLATDCLSF